MKKQMSKKDNALQALKFAAFSASAGVIQVVSFTLLNELVPKTESTNAVLQWLLNSEYGACYLVALTLSVLWNFTLNRKFTFCSANNVPVAMAKVALFYLVFTPVSTWWTAALTDTCGWNEYLVLALTMVVNFATEYLYQRFFVFGNSLDTAKEE